MTRSEKLFTVGLTHFMEEIAIPADGVTPGFVEGVLAANPRLAYFVQGVSFRREYFPISRYVFTVKYRSRELSPSDILLVSTREELEATLCQYIGNYRSRILLAAPRELDVSALVHDFVQEKAVFYPNFTGVTTSSNTFALVPQVYYTLDVRYRIGRATLGLMELEVDREVERLAALLFLPDMPEETKILLAYRYLATTVTYFDREDASRWQASHQQSAYGALIKKSCVCQGYAEAFKRLMDAAGIRSEVLCGVILADADGYHAWNTVTLSGGESYHVDATWSDGGGGRIIYDYFGLSDATLEKERRWNRTYHPPCRAPGSLLGSGRRYILRNRAALLARGIPAAVLGS